MVKRNPVEKKIQRKCCVVGLIAFVSALFLAYFLLENIRKNEQAAATYTAQNTVRRIQAQLDEYVTCSNVLENVILAGYELNEEGFSALASMLPNEDGVVKAFELAPKGVVAEIYPMEENAEAIGLDLLTAHERAADAKLAKESMEYTIAGPFELRQGGTGALLFNPVYQMNAAEQREFWGFIVLVIDWDKFVAKMGLDRLSEADYCYRIWKEDSVTGEPNELVQCPHTFPKDRLTVDCTLPNDRWYFDIIPSGGWIPISYWISDVVICYVLSLLIAALFYLFFMKRYHEQQYAEKLQLSAVEAQEASEAKTRFLFNMSHDIRTPMNAIMGFTELLNRNIDDQEKARGYLRKIQNASSLLLTIINQVLEMARIESGTVTLKLEATDLSALFHSVNTVFEADIQKKNIQYSEDAHVPHQFAYCDKTKLEEIYLNIVSNAIKYTTDGHAIRVEIHELPSEDKKKACYRFTCEDSGIGMSADYLPHIFDEFSREHTTTENKVVGTGLGLPIVKSLIEQMGGTIQVESTQGVGTKFTVDLALTLASREEVYSSPEASAEAEHAKLRGRRILLAEDNDLNAEIAIALLGEEGLLIERAADGEECCTMLAQAPEGYYDLILMDIQMPRMNGYEAAAKIRGMADVKKAGIPIIAMTANAFAEDRQAALDAGMNAHVAKPIDMAVLLPTLLRWL
ncbi:MAG: ATP-binding protein [Oribacterium sp.]|nr:ATP-binding protein [Oribacterium sp.]